MGLKKVTIDYFELSYLAERLASKMLSRVVGLSASGLLGLRPRPALKTVFGFKMAHGVPAF